MDTYARQLADAFTGADPETREAFHAAYRHRHRLGAPPEAARAEYSNESLHAAFERVLARYRESVPLPAGEREPLPHALHKLFLDAIATLPEATIRPFFRMVREKGHDLKDPDVLPDLLTQSLRHYVATQDEIDIVS